MRKIKEIFSILITSIQEVIDQKGIMDSIDMELRLDIIEEILERSYPFKTQIVSN